MAHAYEKNGDLVFNGFEQGISPSPHKGIANLQNVNISTEMGEVMNSFVRTQDTMTNTSATGSLAFADSSHVSLSIANTNNLFKGTWITVTSSSNTGQLPNGTYYVPPSTGSNFQLANYYNAQNTVSTNPFSLLVVGGGGGGGTGAAGYTVGGGGGGGAVVTASPTIISGVSYAVTIGAGGAANTTGSSTSFSTITTAAGGGAGGHTGSINGGAGANGGGGGSSNGVAGTAGTGTFAGGTGFAGNGSNGAGGGGGGASAIGSNAPVIGTGGNGGAGISSSISGSAVTYGSGGGGGAGATGGTGGSGAGSGGTNTIGSAATANLGGGGGGGAGANAGGVGGSGVVIISALIGTVSNPTTCGGTHTTSGGYDIWTFTASGTWTPTVATVSVPSYLTGFTTGLTANFTMVATIGKPIASCTETYYASGVVYHRYYILDSNNLVWVYDDQNEVTYASTDNVGWFLPDYQTNWCTYASGIAVISGFLVAGTSTGLFAKSVALLGQTNAQTTTWVQIPDATFWAGAGTSISIPHFCYVGHQGNLYVTDGAYVANLQPISTISDSTGAESAQNVQSFDSWTAATQFTLTPSIISGTSVIPSDYSKGVPVVFFTNSGGSLPTYISANTIYYISYRLGTFNDLRVYPTSNVTPTSALTLSGSILSGATSATLSTAFTGVTGNYNTTFNNTNLDQRAVLYTNGSTAISWTTPLTGNAGTAITISNAIDIQTGANGTQYFNTFYPLSVNTESTSTTPLYYYQNQRLALPVFETAQCMAEIGNIVVIGCKSNTLYPWDQIQNLPANIISLPESNTVNIITVHQMGYVFTGNKGNIYLTDGNIASAVTTVPDYCAGVPGTPTSYIEPVFSWGGGMYLRGRVYFSILDQTSTKAGNCGGVWSFTPTQNLYIGQDVGIALRLENQSSYGTYNGVASVLIPKVNQNVIAPQYFSGWYSSVSNPLYGIDTTGTGTNVVSVGVIETDLAPTGTMLDKQTDSKIEYKVSSPLLSNETVTMNYRLNGTDAWTSCGTVITDTPLSGYFTANFQKGQWLQLQGILTPTTSTSSSFNRLVEIRVHQE